MLYTWLVIHKVNLLFESFASCMGVSFLSPGYSTFESSFLLLHMAGGELCVSLSFFSNKLKIIWCIIKPLGNIFSVFTVSSIKIKYISQITFFTYLLSKKLNIIIFCKTKLNLLFKQEYNQQKYATADMHYYETCDSSPVLQAGHFIIWGLGGVRRGREVNRDHVAFLAHFKTQWAFPVWGLEDEKECKEWAGNNAGQRLDWSSEMQAKSPWDVDFIFSLGAVMAVELECLRLVSQLHQSSEYK